MSRPDRDRWWRSRSLRLGLVSGALAVGSAGLVVTNLWTLEGIAQDSGGSHRASSCRALAWELLYHAGSASSGDPERSGEGRAKLRRLLPALEEGLEALRVPAAKDKVRRPAEVEETRELERAQARLEARFEPALAALEAGRRLDHEELAGLEQATRGLVAALGRWIVNLEAERSDRMATIRARQKRFAWVSLLLFLSAIAIGIDTLRRLRSLLVPADADRKRDEIDAIGEALTRLTARSNRAEAALREAEERFLLFMRHLPGIAFMKDREGRLVWANDAFQKNLGLGGSSWQGRTDAELWPPATAQLLEATDTRVRSTRAAVAAIETTPGAEGDRQWLAVRFPVLAESGEVTLLGGIGIDITERIRADLAREQSQRRYAAIVETAVDGIISIDERGTIESVNPASTAIFGYRREEMLGQNVRMLMPEPYRSQHDAYLGNYLRTGEAKIIGIGREVSGRRKDGTVFPMELGVSEIELQGRRGFTGVVRDITRRRRTELLAEMGTIAAGMAHEIGTPMNVILGRAEHIREQIHDPAMAHGLDVIIAQVERIARLMNQLLQFTRPHPLDRRPADLNRIVQDTLYVVQDRCKKRGIELELNVDATLPRVALDLDRMGQLLLNLIVNAIDAMPQGGKLGVATAAIRNESGAVEAVEICVSDDGAGIAPEHLERIFTPFFSTKGTGKGTGLGLSVVRGIVSEHDGSIAVESQAGKGSTFRVRLPADSGARGEPR